MAQRKTYLSDQELEEFRSLLTERRGRLQESITELEKETANENRSQRQGSELSDAPTHPADVGTENYEREMSLRLLAREQRELVEIDEALRRIEDKTYGICVVTGKPIGKERLLAKPWAKFDIEYARDNPESLQP